MMRAILLALFLVAPPLAQERPLPDLNSFTAQVRSRLATDEERQSGYVYTERRGGGGVTGGAGSGLRGRVASPINRWRSTRCIRACPVRTSTAASSRRMAARLRPTN